MKQYFAALPSDELAKELGKKIKRYNDFIVRTGQARLWQCAMALYFGRHLGESGARMTSIADLGDDGELKGISVNDFRNLIKHTMALTTAQKPAFDPRAKNTDLESIQQARLFSNIIDDYVTEKRMNRHMVSAAERSLVMSRGSVYMTWEPSLGRPYTTDTVKGKDGQSMMDDNGQPKEKIVYEGDVAICAKSPCDVIGDPKVSDKTKHKWRIVRERENKWDLAARYPHLAEDILKLDGSDPLNEGLGVNLNLFFEGMRAVDDDEDMVPVYHFYHIKCDAAPNGRYMKLLGPDLWTYDGPIQYRRLPVFDITPGDIFDTAEGYSDSNDIMVLQKARNVMVSAMFTNLQAFGVQFVHLPEGCELSASQLNKGLAFLKGGPPGTEPKGINLTASPPALVEFAQVLAGDMEKLMGINSVIRGDPAQNLKSGAALGRVQAMAIQFASNFQRSWAELLEDCGSFLLQLLQDFAKTERVVALAGKHNKGAMQSFTGESLKGIDRVAVDLGNPIARTVAGRLELADNLLAKGGITAKEYIQVAETGQLDSATESEESQLELVRKENEALMDGKPVRAIVGDQHLLHGEEHLVVLNDPLIRDLAAQGDPKALAVVQSVTMHIQEHEQLFMTQSPFFSMISKAPPPPEPPPMPGPGGPPMEGGPQGPPPPGMGPQQPPDAPPIPDLPPLPPAEPMPA